MKQITTKSIETIKKILNKVYEDDQKYRKKSKKMLDKFGPNSKEVKEAILEMEELDKKNLERVEIILNDYGWLSEDIIGVKENATLFLVLQHADLETQLKYYPIMEEAVDLGCARASDLAMLQDRILVKQGKKQMYGTQLIYDETEGKYILEPLVYPERVEERRKVVGLQPMNEYLEYYGLSWEEEKSKRR